MDAMNESVAAADGSLVTPLDRSGTRLSTARFVFDAGAVGRAIVHRTVSESWAVVSGTGRMWRRDADIVRLAPGSIVVIAARTPFQVRADGNRPLTVLGTTVPAWPLDPDEAALEATVVDGPWMPTV